MTLILSVFEQGHDLRCHGSGRIYHIQNTRFSGYDGGWHLPLGGLPSALMISPRRQSGSRHLRGFAAGIIVGIFTGVIHVRFHSARSAVRHHHDDGAVFRQSAYRRAREPSDLFLQDDYFQKRLGGRAAGGRPALCPGYHHLHHHPDLKYLLDWYLITKSGYMLPRGGRQPHRSSPASWIREKSKSSVWRSPMPSSR